MAEGDAGPTRRMVLAGLAVGAVAARAAAAEPGGASDWSAGDHFRVRLIDAGPSPRDAGQRLAGIQVELDPGYLTYWRSPGEAGVPPSASFAGSDGLKTATLLFPAPDRYSEGGTEAIGYKDAVLFPVLVVPKDAAKPVDLHMSLDFGICERLCLPARAQAALRLDRDGTSPEAGLVRDALARVPVLAQLGEAGPLVVTAVEGKAGDDTLGVLVRAQGSAVPMLFAEAPDPWFVQAGEGLWTNAGLLRYQVAVLAKPTDPAPLPLRLTLVGGEGAIEVPVTLDAPPANP